jgi:O-antigen ligase
MYWSLTLLFLTALIFSYSRAAWLSLMLAFGVWVLVALRIKFRTVAIAGSVVAILLFFFMGDIIRNMEKNTTESSGDLMEHVRSIYNIKTDASNMERVNRWNAAIEMFKERPVFGWGPGTYMFLYAPFQRSYDKTVISTNFGTGGNAHSEYLGLMAEAGILGALGYILILVLTLVVGFRGISKIEDKQYRRINIACIMGLITYIAHGFLNNFLDADKIAAPFWGFIAIIVALNIPKRHTEAKAEKELG